MARSFFKAAREHRSIMVAASENEPLAAGLWASITGVGVAPTAGYPEAVLDTFPDAHAALLATDDVAAAWAFSAHWQRWLRESWRAKKLAPFEVRDIARTVWAEFATKAASVDELARGFGWDLSQAWKTFSDVQTAGVHASEAMAIARLAGRMYAALRGGEAKRVAGIPSEVYSIEQGNDVSRLLPSELAQLTDDILSAPVLHRISTRRAVQYAMRGSAPASKGPLVLALDESGSMHGARRTWSKAAAIAVARVALEERRPVSVVHFSTSTQVQRLDPRDPASVVQLIRTFLDGGTALGLALSVAADQVRALASRGDKGADVILVTDGVDDDTESQVKAVDALRRLDARLWLVGIECEIGESSALRGACAGYVQLGGAQLADGQSATVLGGTVRP